jgi:hypothetical protein
MIVTTASASTGKASRFGLEDCRQDRGNRPILFIAHGAGGLVCEQALLVCREVGDELGQVFESTKGMVFLGTPHGGSTSNSMMVRRDSSEFMSVQNAFQRLLVKPDVDIKIHCFFEERAMAGGGFVVSEQEAVLLQYPSLGIAGDHTEMTKYESCDDEGYQKVLDVVGQMVGTYS